MFSLLTFPPAISAKLGIMSFTFVGLMSMELLQKRQLKRREKLLSRFVTIIMPFIRKFTSGLISILIFLDEQQLKNTPRSPKIFSMISEMLVTHMTRSLINSIVLNVNDSLLTDTYMVFVLTVKHQIVREISAMPVRNW